MRIKTGVESPTSQIQLEGLHVLVCMATPKYKFYLLDENLGPVHKCKKERVAPEIRPAANLIGESLAVTESYSVSR